MRIENNVIYADKGKKIGRLNAKYREDYYSACSVLPNETIEDFVELEESELPPERPQEPEVTRDERINAKIRERYSESNEFAILRQKDTKPEDFKAYDEYCEQCKREVDLELAKEEV